MTHNESSQGNIQPDGSKTPEPLSWMKPQTHARCFILSPAPTVQSEVAYPSSLNEDGDRWVRWDEHLTKLNELRNQIDELIKSGDALATQTAKYVCSKHYKAELSSWSKARGLPSDLRTDA